MTNMRNEKYIICLEVFRNLSLFLKSLPIFFHDNGKNIGRLLKMTCKDLPTLYIGEGRMKLNSIFESAIILEILLEDLCCVTS